MPEMNFNILNNYGEAVVQHAYLEEFERASLEKAFEARGVETRRQGMFAIVASCTVIRASSILQAWKKEHGAKMVERRRKARKLAKESAIEGWVSDLTRFGHSEDEAKMIVEMTIERLEQLKGGYLPENERMSMSDQAANYWARFCS